MWFVVVAMLLAAAVAAVEARWLGAIGRAPLAAAGVAAFAAVVLSMVVQDSVSVAEQIGGYNEFLNGVVYRTEIRSTGCSKNGSCVNTYRCDPVEVAVTHYTHDSKGNVTGSYVTWHTEWSDCPYSTVEVDYVVHVTYVFKEEEVVIDRAVFPPNPVEWRPGSGLPAVQRGPSPAWSAIDAEVKGGSAPPWTTTHTYSNYVLASQDSILRLSSHDILKYRRAHLLPSHTVGVGASTDPTVVTPGGKAAKFTTVGVAADHAAWNDALMRVNARLGTELQGDMHVVAVDAAKVDSPDRYAAALVADWQSARYGKWAFPKNGIVVVLGVEDGTVAWARAKTGMPTGNGAMLAMLRSRLTGVSFTPESVLGTTLTHPGRTPKYGKHSGVVPSVVFDKAPFKRACMECGDPGEAAADGFTYLGDEVVPNVSPRTRLIAGVTLTFVFAAIFAAASYVSSLQQGDQTWPSPPTR